MYMSNRELKEVTEVKITTLERKSLLPFYLLCNQMNRLNKLIVVLSCHNIWFDLSITHCNLKAWMVT